MEYPQHDRLANRSFIGLLIAQFQAAFSDQTIQASAMFYAIRQKAMPESVAISLLPILFYSPWALFVTWAGYLADKFGKHHAIRFWKVFEVGIVIVTFLGFYLGTVHDLLIGPYLVMSTVFLMGMQSAFFVPAKYGIMPEMLKPHLLSRGNGILESLSFLAIILGTVTGGVLIYIFGPNVLPEHEPWLGVILIGLSLIGASCSFMVEKIPAAHPDRKFPVNPLKPIFRNVGTVARSRPLLFAFMGIAFFIFMVAFMRNTMYMHGESRIPRWDEMHTSLVVGVVALGIGLGSPMAGHLSGGKVELGLVPVGAVGMILALTAAALVLNIEVALVTCVACIGFFTGFYIVPLFTLLQHRAPKESKGDMVATSNFVNVIGAISASILFWIVVQIAAGVGVIYEVPTELVVRGELIALEKNEEGLIEDFTVRSKSGKRYQHSTRPEKKVQDAAKKTIVEREGLLEPKTKAADGTKVVVIRFAMRHEGAMPWSDAHLVQHYRIQPADLPVSVSNESRLPRYLFLGAAVMTLLILLLLWRELPDLFARSLLWLQSHGRYHLKVVGMPNLPSEGPVILATNCDDIESALQVVAITDRSICFLVAENPNGPPPRGTLRYLAKGTDTFRLPKNDSPEWPLVVARAEKTLQDGGLLGITIDGEVSNQDSEELLQRFRSNGSVPILPVYCGHIAGDGAAKSAQRHVWVVIGEKLSASASVEEVRRRIRLLKEWIQQTLEAGRPPSTAAIPKASDA